jgi:hypothetical protein
VGSSLFVSDYFLAVVTKIVLELLSGFRHSVANATNPSTLAAQVRPHTFPFALGIVRHGRTRECGLKTAWIEECPLETALTSPVEPNNFTP